MEMTIGELKKGDVFWFKESGSHTVYVYFGKVGGLACYFVFVGPFPEPDEKEFPFRARLCSPSTVVGFVGNVGFKT